MDSLISGLKFGTKQYFTKNHFTNINNLYKSKFGGDDEYNEMLMNSSSDDEYNEMLINSSSDVKKAFMISNLFIAIMIIASIVIGFMAVSHICEDQTERGKNTRLGLYILLILTGGQIGWLYVLLWVFKVNVCT